MNEVDTAGPCCSHGMEKGITRIMVDSFSPRQRCPRLSPFCATRTEHDRILWPWVKQAPHGRMLMLRLPTCQWTISHLGKIWNNLYSIPNMRNELIPSMGHVVHSSTLDFLVSVLRFGEWDLLHTYSHTSHSLPHISTSQLFFLLPSLIILKVHIRWNNYKNNNPFGSVFLFWSYLLNKPKINDFFKKNSKTQWNIMIHNKTNVFRIKFHQSLKHKFKVW
jgi:hypothetical protein